MSKTFFNTGQQLAQIFTQYSPAGKYYHNNIMFPEEQFSGCMKPIEYFMNDIHKNLIEWACDSKNIFYKTKLNWYMFCINEEHKTLINMSCFSNSSWERVDDWANKSSVDCLGKEWLLNDLNKYKRVNLFNGSN